MIEITTAIALLISSFSPISSALAQDVGNSLNTQSLVAIENPVTLETYVRNYFAETPVLAEISRCESHFRQFDSEGNVLRGTVNKSDVGLMQINEYYHQDKADELELDLKTIEGNLAYAKYLYDKQGVTPWKASSKCWK